MPSDESLAPHLQCFLIRGCKVGHGGEAAWQLLDVRTPKGGVCVATAVAGVLCVFAEALAGCSFAAAVPVAGAEGAAVPALRCAGNVVTCSFRCLMQQVDPQDLCRGARIGRMGSQLFESESPFLISASRAPEGILM